GLVEDPATSHRLDQPKTAEAIFRAYKDWVGSALFLSGIPRRQLFEVLDAADRWLTATGHHPWGSSILLARAVIHNRLRELDAAVAAAEEALAAYQPDTPGTDLASLQ